MVHSKICRLCAEEKDNFIRIYEEEGEKLNLATKIIQCLQIWLYPEDPLPKIVCIVCCAKLDQYFDFFETTSRAQLSLQVMFDPKISSNKVNKKNACVVSPSSKNQSKAERVKLEIGEDLGNCVFESKSHNEGEEVDTEPPELVECVLSDKESSLSNCRQSVSRRKCRNPIKRTSLLRAKDKVCPKERCGGKTRAQHETEDNSVEDDYEAPKDSLPLQDRLLLLREEKGRVERRNKMKEKENGKRDKIKGDKEDVEFKHVKSDSIASMLLVIGESGSREGPKRKVDLAAPSGIYDDDDERPSGVEGSPMAGLEAGGDKPRVRARSALDGYPWHCTSCGAVLASLQELRRHYLEAHQQPPAFKCVHCAKTYARYRSFARHVKLHRNPKKYKCEECGKCFSQKTVLQSHSTVHSDARPHVCPQCGKAFKQFSSLYLHSKCHLPDQVKPKFPCDVCLKEFATKHTLETHRKIHTGERNFICDMCGKSFIAKGSLDYHILTHSGEKPHRCSVCGKGFKTARLLSKHATLHTGVKPHQCDVCGKQFRERGALREHNRIHTGAMPYTCEFCGKNFRFKGILTVHRRQHTGERPYGCAECRREFTNWANFNKHMKRRHRPPDAAVTSAIPTTSTVSAISSASVVTVAPTQSMGSQVVAAQQNSYQSVEGVSGPPLGVRQHPPSSLPSTPTLGSAYSLPQHCAVTSVCSGGGVGGLPAVDASDAAIFVAQGQVAKMGCIYGLPGGGAGSKITGAGGVAHGSTAGTKMTPMGNGVFHVASHVTPPANHSLGHVHGQGVSAVVVGERTTERTPAHHGNPLVGSYVPTYVSAGLSMGGMSYYMPPIHHTEHGLEILHNRSSSSQ